MVHWEIIIVMVIIKMEEIYSSNSNNKCKMYINNSNKLKLMYTKYKLEFKKLIIESNLLKKMY